MTTETRLLAGRRAIVTGGARGIGRAIADAFADAGATVAVLDLPEVLARRADQPGHTAFACDVTDEAALSRAMQTAAGALGGLEVVVANAGVVPPWRETENLDLVEWERVMAVNVRGVAATLKHAVPLLKAGGGSIVLMASINARVSHPRQMLYTASKHAVLGILRAAALDLGRYRIRVNALAPGPIATEALLQRIATRAAGGGPAVEAALDALATQAPLGRIATEHEVAKAALFLASDLATGVTGKMLPVDAGLMA
jgi:NAD(P)-dependent dehydrogenase (short-subunit alcohol dehydrogenase family)